METRISVLLFKHLKNELTPEERMELDQFIAVSEENRELLARVSDPEDLFEAIKGSKEIDLEAVWQKVKYNVAPPAIPQARILGLTYHMARTALVTLAGVIIIITLFYYFSSKKKGAPILDIDTSNIPVEYFNAMLKTAEGEVLSLQSLKNSSPPYMPQVWITDTQLVYRGNYAKINGIDTLVTPKKALYSVRLPDGSTVWLNCASSLYYSNSFSGNERLVRLEGEAFFDITQDGRPFKVLANGTEIRVMGTKFNVKAYQKEGIMRTTLLEGSVNIKSKEKTETLKAGEEAVINSSGRLEKRKVKGDKRATLAWQKNLFYWDHEPLETIIADICHWHGLQPVYDGPVYSFSYSATIYRSRPLQEILEILAANTPLALECEGDTLLIKPKALTGMLQFAPKPMPIEQPEPNFFNKLN